MLITTYEIAVSWPRLTQSPTVQTEAGCFSQILKNIYQTIRRHIPEESNLQHNFNFRRRESFRSHFSHKVTNSHLMAINITVQPLIFNELKVRLDEQQKLINSRLCLATLLLRIASNVDGNLLPRQCSTLLSPIWSKLETPAFFVYTATDCSPPPSSPVTVPSSQSCSLHSHTIISSRRERRSCLAKRHANLALRCDRQIILVSELYKNST
jgi:hypothetical protein